MPIYQCHVCGGVENTALSDYWTRGYDRPQGTPKPPPLCSACDPAINQWHGRFRRQPANIYKLGSDGFLHSDESIAAGQLDWLIKNAGLDIIGVPPDAYDRAAQSWPKEADPKRLAAFFREHRQAPVGSADRFDDAADLWLPAAGSDERNRLAQEFRRRVTAEEQLIAEYNAASLRETEAKRGEGQH